MAAQVKRAARSKSARKDTANFIATALNAGNSIIESVSNQHARSPESKAIPLDRAGKLAIWKICFDVPIHRMAREKFEDRLFGIPFQVTIGKAAAHFHLNDQMRERVVERHWMPWMATAHRWVTLYGLAPYYFERFAIHSELSTRVARKGGSAAPSSDESNIDTFIPRTPDIFAGDIEIYEKDGKQHYQWRWARDASHPKAGQVDPKFDFIVKDSPTRYGHYTTVMSSLLADTQQLETYRQLEQSVAFQTIVPRHVIEMHPGSAVTAGGGNALEGAPMGATSFYNVTGPDAGEPRVAPNRAMAAVLAYQRGAHREDAGTRDVYSEMGMSEMGTTYNSRPTISSPSPGFAVAELSNHLANNPQLGVMKEGQYLPNSLILNAYESYKKVPPPALPNMNYLDHIQRMDPIYAMSASYPLTMLMNHSGQARGGEFQASQAFLIAELRTWGKFWAKHLKTLFYQANYPFFRQMKRDMKTVNRLAYNRPPSEKDLLRMESNLEIKVLFPRSPHLSFEQLRMYMEHHMISAEDFRRYAMDIIDLSDLAEPKDYKKAMAYMFDYRRAELDAQASGSVTSGGVDEAGESITPTSAGGGGSKKRPRDDDDGGTGEKKKKQKTAVKK